MAKHPHRLLLNQKKTWRCTLPGCRFFIHVGLAHILPGQQSICWECGEEFTLDEHALRDDQPVCTACRARKEGWDFDGAAAYTDAQMALASTGAKSIEELDPGKRRLLEAARGVKFDVLKQPEETEDKPEVIEDEGGHSSECAIYEGGECNCH